ncbi:MAG: ATPase, T2SS/T4P/T4SS family [Terrimicrobiaceae bacterium]|nr:ATPase, T2SS/T4P/T4SS family [Terrimicrobiaceae bacterium]
MTLNELCEATVQAGASDLLLHEGEPLALRITGGIARIDATPVPADVFDALWAACGAGPEARDFDTAYVSGRGERFRVNLFRHLGRRGAVLRHIRAEMPDLDDLGVPAPMLREWVARQSGIILVTGPAGSGKSTTLAACLNHINESSSRHVVTIEDPIEFVFRDNASIFTQREVGIDTASFADGLHQALRQAPDVLFIGEIRDPDSAVTTIRASETGHLVLATIHGADTADALERMSQLLPESERGMLARVFASQLIGVLAQRLLPCITAGFALAAEYFVNVGAARTYIEESRASDLRDFIDRAPAEAAMSMLQSVAGLCRAGIVSESVALATVDKPGELSRALRGITSLTSRR